MKRLVENTGATYKTIAEAAGCSPAQIGHLVTGERDNPAVDHLRGIADFFEADFAWLATGAGRQPTLAHLRDVAAKRGVTRRGKPGVRSEASR